MATQHGNGSVSRRATLAALAAGGLGLALAGDRAAAARQDAGSMADHPILGAWMVTTPIGPSMAVFTADGINTQGVTTTQMGPNGVEFVSPQVGLWEPDGDRRIHFTGVQFHTDAEGNYLGSVTIDGHPRVSEDGMTFTDDAPETTVTIRDAANNVVNVIPGPPAPPAKGVRMGVGNPGFPEGTPEAATPAS